MSEPSPLPPLDHPVRTIGRRTFDFSRQIVVMAIVNRTRDSFFDGGATLELQPAVDAALAAAQAGAGWVDIGAVPFSPDTANVSEDDELERIVPVVEAVVAASDVVVSVDTYRVAVAERALAAGASVINDTSGLRDPQMAELVAGSAATLVITHSRARPREHLRRPQYADVVQDVHGFLVDKIELAVRLGLPPERVIIDPGHDLNKNTLHSLELTRRLGEIAAIGVPVVASISNKDFIGEATGRTRNDRAGASLTAAVVCALNGARILRMHDAAGSRAAADLLEVLLGFRKPAYLRHNVI